MSQEVLEILKSTDAFLEGHFLLSSGKHSDQYVQCAKVLRFPDAAEKVLAPVVEQLKNLEIDKVVGPAMGGVIVAFEIGRQLGKESIFTERKDGVMELRRGFEIKPGEKVIITEDVVTTGKSTIETKKVLEALGAEVLGVACIADRRGPGVEINMPIFTAIKLEITAWDPEDCPVCKEGKMPVVKPGSRGNA
ncbi:MAG: orotate phosphoribosyltransferase [Eubacteriaceae bacterium]